MFTFISGVEEKERSEAGTEKEFGGGSKALL